MILGSLLNFNRNIKKTFLFFCCLCFGAVLFYYKLSDFPVNKIRYIGEQDFFINTDYASKSVQEFFAKRDKWSTSNLGSILFKNATVDELRINRVENKTFVILIWSYYNWLKTRHVKGFANLRNSPLDDCSVRNCIITGDNSTLSSADAVVVHIQHGRIPSSSQRRRHQRWIFLTDESPVNAFSLARNKPSIEELAKVFNWSMSYRSTSDVPVPYGRTVVLPKPIVKNLTATQLEELIPNWKSKRKDVLITIMMSNCKSVRRITYLNELVRHIEVDGYGSCFPNNAQSKSCPGHFRADCPIISTYLFYLVMENSLCAEYLTEKAFYNAYSKGAIPIIMGPTRNDTELILPHNSYLHVDDFSSPKELARKVIEINEDRKQLLKFHIWRNHFRIENEHGYFASKSQHYCRVCEALNYNDRSEKVYGVEELKLYFDPDYSCR